MYRDSELSINFVLRVDEQNHKEIILADENNKFSYQLYTDPDYNNRPIKVFSSVISLETLNEALIYAADHKIIHCDVEVKNEKR